MHVICISRDRANNSWILELNSRNLKFDFQARREHSVRNHDVSIHPCRRNEQPGRYCEFWFEGHVVYHVILDRQFILVT
jgi:hypothetical protein